MEEWEHICRQCVLHPGPGSWEFRDVRRFGGLAVAHEYHVYLNELCLTCQLWPKLYEKLRSIANALNMELVLHFAPAPKDGC